MTSRMDLVEFFETAVNDKLRVYFPGVGKVNIKKEVWTNCNRDGKVVGQLIQYPLILSYAVTCHKSQVLTLDSAVVHFSSEFVSGLTYITVSRVKMMTCHMRMEDHV